ncbi:Protein of unknown function [Bacillus mycoides]|nr:Protein of unknown function [Bacillus mycoides]
MLELDGKRTITKLVYLPRQDWSENDHILTHSPKEFSFLKRVKGVAQR